MVKVYDKFEEVLDVDGAKFNVTIIHRDWNPMPGQEHTMPEGAVWEVLSLAGAGGRPISTSGNCKEEALLTFRRQVRFYTVYGALMNPNRPELKQALADAHQDVEDTIEVWHVGESENGLVEFLCWTPYEYKIYVEDNILPVIVVKKHLGS